MKAVDRFQLYGTLRADVRDLGMELLFIGENAMTPHRKDQIQTTCSQGAGSSSNLSSHVLEN